MAESNLGFLIAFHLPLSPSQGEAQTSNPEQPKGIDKNFPRKIVNP